MYIPKYRNWFVTINMEAQCYDSVLDILKECRCKYALIFHEADEEIDNEHIHFVVEFENARSFKTMQNKFVGAHLDVPKYLSKAYQYLTHQNDKEKRQYSLSDVVSNIPMYELENIYESVDEVTFTIEDFEERITQDHSICNLVDVIKIYGLKQTNKYRYLIKDLIQHYETKFQVENTCLKIMNLEKLEHQLEKQHLLDRIEELEGKLKECLEKKS